MTQTQTGNDAASAALMNNESNNTTPTLFHLVDKIEREMKIQRKLLFKLKRQIEIHKAQIEIFDALEAVRVTQLTDSCKDKNFLEENGLVWEELKLFNDYSSDSGESKSSSMKKVVTKPSRGKPSTYQQKKPVATVQFRQNSMGARCA
jgi:hypothetical protein